MRQRAEGSAALALVAVPRQAARFQHWPGEPRLAMTAIVALAIAPLALRRATPEPAGRTPERMASL